MTRTDFIIRDKVKELLYLIIRNITRYFDPDELEFLSFQERIENTLRNKIAWQMQLALDSLYQNKDLDYRYLVRVEWSPTTGREKCDMAVLRLKDDTNDYSECIAMFEFKAHSHQWWDETFFNAFDDDEEKLLQFSDVNYRTKEADLYYIFFQHLHLKRINTYKLACTYLHSTNRCFDSQRDLDKAKQINSLIDYWDNMFTSPYDVIENDLGSYFDHQSFLETVICKIDKNLTVNSPSPSRTKPRIAE